MTKLSDKTVTLGKDVGFEVTVAAVPTPDVQWFLDDRKLNSNGHVSVEVVGNHHSLSIERCTIEDAGKIVVVATNRFGSTYEGATLITNGECI